MLNGSRVKGGVDAAGEPHDVREARTKVDQTICFNVYLQQKGLGAKEAE